MLIPLLHLNPLVGVPNPHGLVRGGRANILAVRSPVQVQDRALVALENGKILAVPLHVPQKDLLVHRPRGEALAVGGELHSEDLRPVALALHDRRGEARKPPHAVLVDPNDGERRGPVLLRQCLLSLDLDELRARGPLRLPDLLPPHLLLAPRGRDLPAILRLRRRLPLPLQLGLLLLGLLNLRLRRLGLRGGLGGLLLLSQHSLQPLHQGRF
mmetsp:Transcript_2135/g.7124  ORF Transcript_2135/g.7124 Transcript_2135/m.7124 type:complete len:213 (+) Transcript_2135:806-1444(+)